MKSFKRGWKRSDNLRKSLIWTDMTSSRKPSDGYYPVTYFSTVKPDLFLYILRKFDPNWGKHPGHMSRGAGSRQAGTDMAEEH